MITQVEREKFEKERVRRLAVERLAATCPVIMSINKTIEEVDGEGEILDIKYLIDRIKVGLGYMPEAKPTIRILCRVADYGKS